MQGIIGYLIYNLVKHPETIILSQILTIATILAMTSVASATEDDDTTSTTTIVHLEFISDTM